MRILEKICFSFFFSNFLFQKMFLSKCLCYIGGEGLSAVFWHGGSTFQTLGFSSSQIKNQSELVIQGKKKRKKKQLNIRTLEREREREKRKEPTSQVMSPSRIKNVRISSIMTGLGLTKKSQIIDTCRKPKIRVWQPCFHLVRVPSKAPILKTLQIH